MTTTGKIDGEIGENIEFEEIPNSDTPIDKTNIANDAKRQDETHDFMKSNSFTSDYIKKGTKEATVEDEPVKEQTVEEIRDQIKKDEEKLGSEYSAADFQNIAEVIIEVIDAIGANIFKAWAGDTTDRPYQLPNDKKKLLSKQLAGILIKYQAKFPLEAMFLITLVGVYYGSFMKAKAYKKYKTHKPGDQTKAEDVTFTEIKVEENGSSKDEPAKDSSFEQPIDFRGKNKDAGTPNIP